MVAGTAASVGLALANDRRLKPVFVEAAPHRTPLVASSSEAAIGAFSTARDFVARRIAIATLIGVAVLMCAASLPAISAFASSFRSPSSGPQPEAGTAASTDAIVEQPRPSAQPALSLIEAQRFVLSEQQHNWDVLRAMKTIDAERIAAASAAAVAAESVTRAAAAPYTMNAESGLAAGTVLRARITIYGCTGPGGGFCNHMASGGTAFEGAAACSGNLPFGTRLRITGDPTGRIYECLDRGALSATWVDVYFENTSDGIAWQSQLGSTIADIEIVN